MSSYVIAYEPESRNKLLPQEYDSKITTKQSLSITIWIIKILNNAC